MNNNQLKVNEAVGIIDSICYVCSMGEWHYTFTGRREIKSSWISVNSLITSFWIIHSLSKIDYRKRWMIDPSLALVFIQFEQLLWWWIIASVLRGELNFYTDWFKNVENQRKSRRSTHVLNEKLFEQLYSTHFHPPTEKGV